MVEEAGGTVTHIDGGKFTLDSREVLATNGLIAEEMRHLFAEMFAGRGMGEIPTPAEFAARRKAAGMTAKRGGVRIGIMLMITGVVPFQR